MNELNYYLNDLLEYHRLPKNQIVMIKTRDGFEHIPIEGIINCVCNLNKKLRYAILVKFGSCEKNLDQVLNFFHYLGSIMVTRKL